MNTDISAFDLPQTPTNSNQLKELFDMANDLVQLEGQIADIEQLLKTLSGKANELKTQTLPNKMTTVGLTYFETPSGHSMSLEDFIAADSPKDKKLKEKINISRIEELNRIGGADLIMTEVAMTFGKKEHNSALALADELRKAGHNPLVTSGVNVQSLKAFIREKLRGGEEFDQTKLGLFVGRQVKLEVKK